MFRSILLMASIFLIYAFFNSEKTDISKQAESTEEAVKVDTRDFPDRFQIIPGDEVINYRSAQPTLEQLQAMIGQLKIEVVIRLNGNEGGLNIDQEKAFCERNKIQFVRLNAHLSENGPGYDASGKVASTILRDGNVLIHCQHGYDRVGALVGYWLKENGLSRSQIIEHNDWDGYLEKKGESYREYWNTISD